MARQIKLSRRVEMVKLAMDEVRQLKTAKGIFRRQRKHLPSIAVRRADLEAKRSIFEIEIDEKRFERERALTLNGELEPLPRELQIADQRDQSPIESAPYLRENIVRDAETGAELRKVRGHWRKMTGKKGGVRTAQLVPEELKLPDEPGLSLPADPRLPPVPAPEPIETAPEPIDEIVSEQPPTPPTIEAILERGRSGELLSDEEIAALAQAGAVEQGPDGAWREIASAPQ